MSTPFDTVHGLLVRDVRGDYREATVEEILDAARRVMARRVRRGTAFTDPSMVGHYLRGKLSMLEHELFVALLVDSRHRLIEYVELFRGTIDGAEVHPREVAKAALRANAAAVIVAHNHPSGCAEPSAADRAVTAQLKQALALVDVRLLDHFVVAGADVVSMAARGWV
jgi:DNA repair protein RadC